MTTRLTDLESRFVAAMRRSYRKIKQKEDSTMTTKSAVAVDVDALLKNATKLSADYPARWEAAQVGESLIGVFLGFEDWQNDDMKGRSYTVRLSGSSPDVVLTTGSRKSAVDVAASEWVGKIVSLSGKMLSPLDKIAAGTSIGVTYQGEGARRTPKSAPLKKYDVFVLAPTA